MGRNRTTPASTTAASSAIPSLSFSSMKSTRMMLFRTMMPAPAMKPIMLVAVKNAPSSPWPGMMPMSESGIGARITTGTMKACAARGIRTLINVELFRERDPKLELPRSGTSPSQ